MESPWNVLWLSVYISLFSSLFGLPFTLGLAWAWALALRAENAKWLIPTLPMGLRLPLQRFSAVAQLAPRARDSRGILGTGYAWAN